MQLVLYSELFIYFIGVLVAQCITAVGHSSLTLVFNTSTFRYLRGKFISLYLLNILRDL